MINVEPHICGSMMLAGCHPALRRRGHEDLTRLTHRACFDGAQHDILRFY